MAKTSKKRGRKMGRPRSKIEKKTISFRVPCSVEDAFGDLVDVDSQARVGSNLTHSELYNQALAAYLLGRGVEIPGYNAPSVQEAS